MVTIGVARVSTYIYSKGFYLRYNMIIITITIVDCIWLLWQIKLAGGAASNNENVKKKKYIFFLL